MSTHTTDNLELVTNLAKLSRLELDHDEKETISNDIANILEFVGQLGEVTDTASVPDIGLVKNVMRSDDHVDDPGLYTPDMVAAFPQADSDGNLIVPKIL